MVPVFTSLQGDTNNQHPGPGCPRMAAVPEPASDPVPPGNTTLWFPDPARAEMHEEKLIVQLGSLLMALQMTGAFRNLTLGVAAWR